MTGSMIIPIVVIVVIALAVLLLNRAEFRAVFRKKDARRPPTE
jgi:hypothetical protein